MFDPGEVRDILISAARQRTALTYSEMLNILGHTFTRPLMRQLCKVLDAIDQDGRAAGEPGLAVLVVRQSDGLPGQGWFVTRTGFMTTCRWNGRARKRGATLGRGRPRPSITGNPPDRPGHARQG